MAVHESHLIWADKYRPRKVSDIILPDNLTKQFTDIVDKGVIPNMTFSGSAGIGKTTVALALADELGYETLILNGSGHDRGIDTVNNKISQFAKTMSFDGSRKLVLVDEGDNQTRDAQLALRAEIENVSDNCSFIITCNHVNKIEEAILSRCPDITFVIPKKETVAMKQAMVKRCVHVMKDNGYDVNKTSLENIIFLVNESFPDFRSVLGRLQHVASYINNSKAIQDADDMTSLVDHMKKKNLAGINEWMSSNALSPSKIYSWFGDPKRRGTLFKTDQAHVEAAILAADYDYNSSFCTDTELNLRAFLYKLTALCDKKWVS